jgi:hypothetical protein
MATNTIQKTDALNINKYWNVSGDHAIFARVKYLVILKLTIATLFTQVFVMRHHIFCSWLLCFSSGLTCGLLKNHRTPQQLCCFIPTCQCGTSQVPQLQLLCHKSSREIMGSDYVLKRHSASGQGDHLYWVHTDQMVLEMMKLGRLVR